MRVRVSRLLCARALQSELNFPIGEKENLDLYKDGHRWKLPMALFDMMLLCERLALAQLEGNGDDVGVSSRVELPSRMQFSGRGAESEALVSSIVRTLVIGFHTKALSREPHMVLLREDFYSETPASANLRVCAE